MGKKSMSLTLWRPNIEMGSMRSQQSCRGWKIRDRLPQEKPKIAVLNIWKTIKMKSCRYLLGDYLMRTCPVSAVWSRMSENPSRSAWKPEAAAGPDPVPKQWWPSFLISPNCLIIPFDIRKSEQKINEKVVLREERNQKFLNIAGSMLLFPFWMPEKLLSLISTFLGI